MFFNSFSYSLSLKHYFLLDPLFSFELLFDDELLLSDFWTEVLREGVALLTLPEVFPEDLTGLTAAFPDDCLFPEDTVVLLPEDTEGLELSWALVLVPVTVLELPVEGLVFTDGVTVP